MNLIMVSRALILWFDRYSKNKEVNFFSKGDLFISSILSRFLEKYSIHSSAKGFGWLRALLKN